MIITSCKDANRSQRTNWNQKRFSLNHYLSRIVWIYERVHSSVSPQQSHLAKSTSFGPGILFTGPLTGATSGPGFIPMESLITLVDIIPENRASQWKSTDQEHRDRERRKRITRWRRSRLTYTNTMILNLNRTGRLKTLFKLHKNNQLFSLSVFFLIIIFLYPTRLRLRPWLPQGWRTYRRKTFQKNPEI